MGVFIPLKAIAVAVALVAGLPVQTAAGSDGKAGAAVPPDVAVLRRSIAELLKQSTAAQDPRRATQFLVAIAEVQAKAGDADGARRALLRAEERADQVQEPALRRHM